MVCDDLDDLSGVPRHVQVALIPESGIRAGSRQPGKPVQSRIGLQQRFGVALAAAGKAHAWLAERGYLVPVPGMGMVVTSPDRWPAEPGQ